MVKDYKEELHLLNKFWELDKKKVEDLKNELRQFETIVNTYSSRIKK